MSKPQQPYISPILQLEKKLEQEQARYKNANVQRQLLEQERIKLFDTLLNDYGLLLKTDGSVDVKDACVLESALIKHLVQKKGHPDLDTKELARIAVINKTIARCYRELLLAADPGI